MSRNDVNEILQKRTPKPCVFFLDDFPQVSATNERTPDVTKLCFLLNVSQSFGLVAIVNSMNGSAQKLISADEFSSYDCNKPDEPLCTVFPSLPRFQLLEEVPRKLHELVIHSRPLFANKVQMYVNEKKWMKSEDPNAIVLYMDAMMKNLAQVFTAHRNDSPWFAYSHVHLFLCTSFLREDKEKSRVIRDHYARLEDTNPFRLFRGEAGKLLATQLKTSSDTVDSTKVNWNYYSVFPSPKDDTLVTRAVMTHLRLKMETTTESLS